MNTRIKIHAAFTIVELVIVVAVIAILTSIVVVSYNGIHERAKKVAATSEIQRVQDTVDVYAYHNKGFLPTDLTSLNDDSITSDTFQYLRYDENTQYCVSYTSENVSYYALSTAKEKTLDGACTSSIDWVAGAPLGYTDVPGDNVTLTSTLSEANDITFYAVFSVVDTSVGYVSYAGLGPTSDTNRIKFQAGNVGVDSSGYRVDTSVALNYYSYQTGVLTPGNHIGWIEVTSSGTVIDFGYDKTTSNNTNTIPAHTGWSFDRFYLASTQPTYGGIATTVYDAAHDETTRASIMNWLATKYGLDASY